MIKHGTYINDIQVNEELSRMRSQIPPNGRNEASAEEKQRREIEDLCCVFAALVPDKELLWDKERIFRYVTSDLKKIQDSFHAQNVKGTDFFPLELEPGAPVRIGGSGIVIRCANASQLNLKYALKIPRPSLFEGHTAVGIYEEAVQEFFMHAPLSHENIVRLLAPGKVTIPHAEGPASLFDAILMEWIDDAKPLDSYLVGDTGDYGSVAELLNQALRGLAYLHDMGLIHWDIKSDNFLVSAKGIVKLTDIGNARRTDNLGRGLIAHSTRGNPPDELKIEPEEAAGAWVTSRRTSVHLPDLTWDCPWLDLWMFARELNRLFEAESALFEKDSHNGPIAPAEYVTRARNFLQKVFPAKDDGALFALSFLRLIVRRLLFPRRPSDRMCYKEAKQVNDDLSRLLPEFGGAQSVRELKAIPQRVLRLPRSGNAPWTRRIDHLFNSSPLQRLRKHRQLGGVLYVYPGATHTRLEHAAGVLSVACQYLRALYADRTDPFWRLTMGSREIDTLLLAALLHDVGHIAFGHFIEEMHGLIEGCSHEDYAMLVLSPQCAPMVRFGKVNRKAALVDREVIEGVILAEWGVSERELQEFLQDVGNILRPPLIRCVCTREENKLLPEESSQIQLEMLHSVMDSAIDADKLDYLLRDAHHCGVHYAEGIDADRFFQSLTCMPFLDEQVMSEPLYERSSEAPPKKLTVRASIGVTGKGILPVESMLIARYQMFSCIYWHHTTRAQTVMLQFLVLAYLEGSKSELEVEHRLDALIEYFRRVDDERALLWLRNRLRRQDGPEDVKKRLFEDIANGLLGKDRSLLYWTAFELRYERGSHSQATEIYDGLMRKSDEAASQTSPTAFVEFSRNVRGKFTELFVKKLGKQIIFVDGEILIDIPPSGKDQIDNVFVYENGETRRIQELSPLADAVSAAFRYWVRRPRVFLAPSAWKKCDKALLGKNEVWAACFDALKEMLVPQSDLDFTS